MMVHVGQGVKKAQNSFEGQKISKIAQNLSFLIENGGLKKLPDISEIAPRPLKAAENKKLSTIFRVKTHFRWKFLGFSKKCAQNQVFSWKTHQNQNQGSKTETGFSKFSWKKSFYEYDSIDIQP